MSGTWQHPHWPDPFSAYVPDAPCADTYLQDTGYGSFDGAYAASVGHGGACCAECANGGMCSSQRRAAVGAMTAPSPTELFVVAAVGIGLWALLGFPTASQVMRRLGG